MSVPSSVLILGGVRSGKSRYALDRARALEGPTAFVATARALDAEMALRIQRHKAERPPDWLTVEEPLELVVALRGLVGRVQVAVVDCLIAHALKPEVSHYLLASHCSAEPGHQAILARLGLGPYLDLGLRLGEGTGAALAFALIRAAVAIYSEMATFKSAGVSERAP